MRYSVIAIEREYASGGLEIGEKLAERLGIPCYGQEILERAAVKLRLPPERLADAEEKITGSLLYSLVAFASIPADANPEYLSLEQKLALTEANIIKDLALSPCVIIGRAAAALLKDKMNTIKVFIHADYGARMDRAVNVYRLEPRQAESALRRFDKRRAAFFRAVTSSEWKDPDLYHITLNSGKLGIYQTADVLYMAVK